MGFRTVSSLTSVKGNIADILREEIISQRLSPGEQIVEGRWAVKLKVAQASMLPSVAALGMRMSSGLHTRS